MANLAAANDESGLILSEFGAVGETGGLPTALFCFGRTSRAFPEQVDRHVFARL
jgi:hypothetical protein